MRISLSNRKVNNTCDYSFRQELFVEQRPDFEKSMYYLWRDFATKWRGYRPGDDHIFNDVVHRWRKQKGEEEQRGSNRFVSRRLLRERKREQILWFHRRRGNRFSCISRREEERNTREVKEWKEGHPRENYSSHPSRSTVGVCRCCRRENDTMFPAKIYHNELCDWVNYPRGYTREHSQYLWLLSCREKISFSLELYWLLHFLRFDWIVLIPQLRPAKHDFSHFLPILRLLEVTTQSWSQSYESSLSWEKRRNVLMQRRKAVHVMPFDSFMFS